MAHGEINHYIFTINDTEKEFTDRLAKRLWPVFIRTANADKLTKGDRIVFYKAGTGNHVFAGVSSVESMVKQEPKRYVKLSNIDLWKKPVDITTIFEKLSFIKNKYAYGVYLVNGIKKITKEDFDAIVSSKQK